MYYSKIKTNDISNGPGLRTSIYVSGCRNYCKGCFNKETWDFKYGQPFTKQTLNQLLETLNNPYIKGITILGGEPLEPENQEEVLNIILQIKKNYKDKTIWLFTGYTLEEQIKFWCDTLAHTQKILKNIDVIVDGKFEEQLKDISLGFRGSSNQRIIDMKQTMKQKKIILHDKHNSKEEKKIWK